MSNPRGKTWWLWPALAIALGLLAFALVTADVRAAGRLYQLDEPALRWLRAWEPLVLVYFWAAVSQMGSMYALAPLGVAVAVTLLWQKRWRLLAVWALALLGSMVLNGTLKAYFARPRPYDMTYFRLPAGFTYPSGHTTGATIGYGALALLVGYLWPHWRRPALLAALAISFLEALGLVSVRVHYPTDVLAALGLGWAWVGVCALALGPAGRDD